MAEELNAKDLPLDVAGNLRRPDLRRARLAPAPTALPARPLEESVVSMLDCPPPPRRPAQSLAPLQRAAAGARDRAQGATDAPNEDATQLPKAETVAVAPDSPERKDAPAQPDSADDVI